MIALVANSLGNTPSVVHAQCLVDMSLGRKQVSTVKLCAVVMKDGNGGVPSTPMGDADAPQVEARDVTRRKGRWGRAAGAYTIGGAAETVAAVEVGLRDFRTPVAWGISAAPQVLKSTSVTEALVDGAGRDGAIGMLALNNGRERSGAVGHNKHADVEERHNVVGGLFGEHKVAL